MSFRIDDILRKTNNSDYAVDISSTSSNLNSLWTHPSSLDSENSILHRTLLHPVFGSTNSDYSSSKLYCDKLYYPYSSLDIFTEKVNSLQCVPMYARSPRMWPMYAPNIQPFTYQHYTKRKGGQVRFTAIQTDALEDRFNSHKYLSPEDRRILADTLKLSDRQVKTWFQNRRAKWRRCNNQNSKSPEHNTEHDSKKIYLNNKLY